MYAFIVVRKKKRKKKYGTDEKICMRFVGMDCGVSALLSEATAFLLRKKNEKRKNDFFWKSCIGLFSLKLP